MKKLFSCILAIITVLLLTSNGNTLEIFSWDVETKSPSGTPTNGETLTTGNSPFTDVNTYGGVGTITYSSDHAYSGNFSIRIPYPGNEAGVELKVPAFSATGSLFVRKYEYYSSHWEDDWPLGLKIGRWFTTSNYTRCSSCPYVSEKWWNSGSCDGAAIEGTNYAIKDQDCKWSLDYTFGNDLNYIRPGHWYKVEIWMVMDSQANNVNACTDAICDGVMKMWIDDVLVYSSENFCWHRIPDGTTTDFNWESGWFGGNYSGSTCGNPSETLYRYIDDVYVSSTLDREVDPPDTTPPEFSSATIETNGTTLEVVFNEPVTNGVSYDISHWDIDCSSSGSDISISYESGVGTTTFITTISKTIMQGETCDIDFNGTANSVEDLSGNDLAAIVSGSITNNSAQGPSELSDITGIQIK